MYNLPELHALAEAPTYEPVSLGQNCDAKFQIARVLNERLLPERSPMAFRYAIETADRDAALSGLRLFDWQNTPLSAVCAYLERDFRDVFELEDLEPTDIGVRNRRFDTHHLHAFTTPNGAAHLTPEEIRAQYPAARHAFEVLAEDFRQLLRKSGPYLYVIASQSFPAPAEVARLVELFSRDPRHGFHVLAVGVLGSDADLGSLGAHVSKAWRTHDTLKPARFRWEGHDASWDAALAPFALGFHPERSRHAPRPPPDARLAWKGGSRSVASPEKWRVLGASLEHGDDGARIRTVPAAWHYSHAAELDLSQIDFTRERGWVRLKAADVRGRMLAAVYDPARDQLADEVLIDEGAGPATLYFRLSDPSKSVLLLRTGETDEAAEARILELDVIAA